MQHYIPHEVKTQKKFSSLLFVEDFFAIVFAAGFGLVTQMFVVPSLQAFYVGFCALAALYLTRQSKRNPHKRIIQSLWFFIRRPQTAFIPIEIPKTEMKGVVRHER